MVGSCTISAARFSRRHRNDSAESVISAVVDRLDSRPVLTASVGIQSAVLLHMATRIKPNVAVVWVDTGYLPPETYRHAHQLTEDFRLNLHVYQSEISPARMEAAHGYTSVGDAHLLLRPSGAGQPDRAARFGGRTEECGIQLPDQIERPVAAFDLVTIRKRTDETR
jgi:hypothetical protein